VSTSATIPFRTIPSAGRGLALRIALVPLFVALCYLFPWWWLRIATTTILVQLSAWMGIPMLRVAPDIVSLDGLLIQFIVPCTMVDAFFGAIPLLWRRADGFRNAPRLVGIFVGVFALNLFRLELGFVGIHAGLPWWLAHEVVAGFAYFALFLCIARTRAWAPSPQN
jgi:hypothetical protein